MMIQNTPGEGSRRPQLMTQEATKSGPGSLLNRLPLHMPSGSDSRP